MPDGGGISDTYLVLPIDINKNNNLNKNKHVARVHMSLNC
jgi:hypothetical protein